MDKTILDLNRHLSELEQEQYRHRMLLDENIQKLQRKKNLNKRLIKRGAMIEKLIPGSENLSDQEFEDVLIFLLKVNENNDK